MLMKQCILHSRAHGMDADDGGMHLHAHMMLQQCDALVVTLAAATAYCGPTCVMSISLPYRLCCHHLAYMQRVHTKLLCAALGPSAGRLGSISLP